MEGKILSSLGKTAGLAGIVVGVMFLLFRGILQQQLASLGPAQALSVIRMLMTFTFGTSIVGMWRG
jgi:hypothetical protein